MKAKPTALLISLTIKYYAKFEFMYGDLTITKSGISDLDDHEPNGSNKQEQQSTVYRIYGTSNSGVYVDMEVVIVDNGSVTIKNVPVGDNYTIVEKESWSWRYDASNGTQSATVKGGEEPIVPFSNNRNRIYWLSGDNYCKNLFSGVQPTE